MGDRHAGERLSQETFWKRVRHRLEVVGLRLVGALFRALPMETASWIGGALWRFAAPLTKRHPRALDHLALARPDLDEAERRRIVRAMWDNLGRISAEAFRLDDFEAEPDRIDLSGAEAVAQLAATDRGAVLVSLHMGNWELGAVAARRVGLQAAGVYQEVNNPWVERLLLGLRAPWYPLGLYRRQRDGSETALKLFGIVRRGGTLALLGDLRDGGGIDVPFFGRPAPVTPFPALIARSLGVPLVAVRMLRTKGARFRIEAVAIEVPRTGDRDADVRRVTEALHGQFEAWIRADPEQWFWIHRKWPAED